jgi:hypothetical protein
MLSLIRVLSRLKSRLEFPLRLYAISSELPLQSASGKDIRFVGLDFPRDHMQRRTKSEHPEEFLFESPPLIDIPHSHSSSRSEAKSG